MKFAPRLALFVLFALCAGPSAAENVLLVLEWNQLDEADLALSGGTVVETDQGWSALRIVYEGEEPRTIPLARLSDPGITANQYAISGQVRYEDVPGNSYLEMWNLFAGGGHFFSRTLGSSGPMGALTGTSGWRLFLLPFFLQDSPERPIALEINLALQGPGTVEIGPLTLAEVGTNEEMAGLATGAWWSPRITGLLGGIGGTGLGVLAAILGVLVGLGRARALVTVVTIAMLVAGLVAVALGVLALLDGQPYAVYYPLLLIGGMTVTFMLALLIAAPSRYRMLELRRMRAIDAS